MQQKLFPDPFLFLVNNPKQLLHARNTFKKKDNLKDNYKKSFKKLTLFFPPDRVPFNGQSYKKQKEPKTSD